MAITKTIAPTQLTAANITEEHLPSLPEMTGWFEPKLLLQLLQRVIVSDVFGQYADRRLMEAALDKSTEAERIELTKIGPLPEDTDGAVWVDYVSDLGDGFDATYAIAYLIAQANLKIGEKDLPRAGVLVMGGDEVYPTALREDYKVKMRLPYDLAWPVPKGNEKTPLLLLPGNHDWYDGLVNFLAIFCREKPTKIGGWKTDQRRSYFAAELSAKWWVWGIDIALVRDMDQPQADYFVSVAKHMPEGANIILCSAEPGWYKAESNGDAFRTLSYAAGIARNVDKNLRIPIVLSGDSHHYARYVDSERGTQYITSGGGGAFLHGTLELKPEIGAEWLIQSKEKLTLASCYPSREESAALLAGNANFGRLNRGLTWVFAGFYLSALFILTLAMRVDVAIASFTVLLATLWGYNRYQEGEWTRTAVPSIAHAVGHALVISAFALGALWADQWLNIRSNWHWSVWLGALAIPTLLIGPWLAGKLYGYSLWFGCRYFNISHNDAFSSMQLNTHRHFLRIRLKGDEATIYAVKLEKIPSRSEWKANADRKINAEASVFVPSSPMRPEILEEIQVKGRNATSTAEVKSPAEIPPKK